MAFCRHCGKEIYDDAILCVNCGRLVQKLPQRVNDTGSIGWGFLGSFFPIVGLILYLVWKDEKPYSAKMAGKGALIYAIVSAVFLIFYIVVIVALFASFAWNLNIVCAFI